MGDPVGLKFFLVVLLICQQSILSTDAHKHFGKERLEDGAFSPRDRLHYDNDGEKNSGFAIFL